MSDQLFQEKRAVNPMSARQSKASEFGKAEYETWLRYIADDESRLHWHLCQFFSACSVYAADSAVEKYLIRYETMWEVETVEANRKRSPDKQIPLKEGSDLFHRAKAAILAIAPEKI